MNQLLFILVATMTVQRASPQPGIPKIPGMDQVSGMPNNMEDLLDKIRGKLPVGVSPGAGGGGGGMPSQQGRPKCGDCTEKLSFCIACPPMKKALNDMPERDKKNFEMMMSTCMSKKHCLEVQKLFKHFLEKKPTMKIPKLTTAATTTTKAMATTLTTNKKEGEQDESRRRRGTFLKKNSDECSCHSSVAKGSSNGDSNGGDSNNDDSNNGDSKNGGPNNDAKNGDSEKGDADKDGSNNGDATSGAAGISSLGMAICLLPALAFAFWQ